MKKLFLLIFLLPILLPAQLVLADTGPKPTMEFTFKQDGEELQIISGILYECDQPDCSDVAPLEELGPQRFTCDALSCGATAYGFARYHRIEIEFSDEQTRSSNVFETAGFDSKYTVTVRPDDLLVEVQSGLSTFTRLTTFVVLCILGLCMGVLLVAGIIILIRRRKR